MKRKQTLNFKQLIFYSKIYLFEILLAILLIYKLL